MVKDSEINRIATAVNASALGMFSDKLKNVILYGSFARGDYNETSDVDIFVIIDTAQQEAAAYNGEIAKLASRLSLETDGCRTISITLQDYATYNEYRDYLPYFSNIAKEGVVLYAA